MQEGAPQRSVDDWTGSRDGLDKVEGPVELRLEVSPERWALGLIPRKSLRNVSGGFRSELQPMGHER